MEEGGVVTYKWNRFSFIGYDNLFPSQKHPVDMGNQEIEQFLSSLANIRHVSRATQN
ncbi:phage integrase N-terminal SAM-like domain-containing protein [Shewanella sp. NFH-SH190041]|uniref:phage integrase N-terminal SAM-like domain-containing protein n=1 Tax=Shewanella sp. NFH-SH190041 TaxID=2950245 RepID=UPI003965BD5F